MNKKRIISGFFIFICIFGIYKSSSINVMANEYQDDNLIKKLYCGYDVTSGINLMNPDALKLTHPIIDEKSGYSEFIEINTDSRTQNISSISSSIQTVSQEYAEKFSGNLLGKIFAIDMDVSEDFLKSERIKNIASERYELYSMYIERCRYYVKGLDANDIKKYVSEQFKNDIYMVDSLDAAKRLFDKYGTHLFTGYIFGGRMNVTNYLATSEEDHDLSKAASFTEKMGGFLKKIGASEEVSFEEKVYSIENDATTVSLFNLEAYGGTGSSSASIDNMFTYNGSITEANQSHYMYQKWTASIDRNENLALVGIPDNNNAMCIPVWELLDYSDPRSFSVRDYLLEEFMKLCGDEYAKYMEKYSSMVPSTISTEIDDEYPICKGIYVRTSNNYVYHVEAEDLLYGGKHYGIHKGDWIYLDLETVFDDSISILLTNCRSIDEGSGIFKVNDDISGNIRISAKKDGVTEKEYLNVPIISSNFEGGMGNEAYPYIIANEEQFRKIVNDKNAHYILQSDLNFSGKELTCLGEFNGVLDGNYCTISNFVIKGSKNYGIFSHITRNGIVRNLAVEKAGTSVNNEGFIEGGIDYVNDYEKDEYTKKSTSAVNAGIICGINDGNIENCYVKESFIRDIIKNDYSYENNSQVTVCVGGIAGTNNGNITECMVNNVRLLGSYVYIEDDRNADISVYVGGLVGELHSGVISSCVSEVIRNGSVMSQIVNEYSGVWFDTDNIAKAYATGLVGYCDGTATIKDSFVYVRKITNENMYPSIAAEYKSTDLTLGADIHYALRNTVMICGDNWNGNVQNSYTYTEDDLLENKGIKPVENGDNLREKESYAIVDIFDCRKISSESDFDSINLSKCNFTYSMSDFTGVSHLLERKRTEYIKIYLENKGIENLYAGNVYRLHNLKIKRSINSEKNDDVWVFRVRVTDDKNINMTNLPLKSISSEKYKVIISTYGDEIKANDIVKINVRDANIVGIEVTDSEDKYHIYYDEVSEYFNNWSADAIEVKKVMNDGSRVIIDESEKSKIELSSKLTEIGNGQNSIKIKLQSGEDTFYSSYVLNVDKRDLVQAKVSEPIKTVYNVGDAFSVDGMTMSLEYSEGDPTTKIVELSSNDSNVEIIGGTIVEGENKIAIAYADYKAVDYVTVIGKKNATTENNETNVEEPGLTEDDSSNNLTNDSKNDVYSSQHEWVAEDSNSNEKISVELIIIFIMAGVIALFLFFVFILKKPYSWQEIIKKIRKK